ncbi:PREDICTED: translation initiation factor IF-2-like [Chinchilla lanigera]|uniref:translation initiation factor IF-2-like n=1 Tax=Chinchilla lanigera TaxID=34839 RepID=UPI00038EA244|nr:PREDICTED: translation initiation factor IF-2-like [Chinchilla lanigera]
MVATDTEKGHSAHPRAAVWKDLSTSLSTANRPTCLLNTVPVQCMLKLTHAALSSPPLNCIIARNLELELPVLYNPLPQPAIKISAPRELPSLRLLACASPPSRSLASLALRALVSPSAITRLAASPSALKVRGETPSPEPVASPVRISDQRLGTAFCPKLRSGEAREPPAALGTGGGGGAGESPAEKRGRRGRAGGGGGATEGVGGATGEVGGARDGADGPLIAARPREGAAEARGEPSGGRSAPSLPQPRRAGIARPACPRRARPRSSGNPAPAHFREREAFFSRIRRALGALCVYSGKLQFKHVAEEINEISNRGLRFRDAFLLCLEPGLCGSSVTIKVKRDQAMLPPTLHAHKVHETLKS